MKLTRSHTTATETSLQVISALSKIKGVKKISRGLIRNTRSKSGQKSIKVAQTQSGLKISVRGNGAIQDLYVYTDSPDSVRQIVESLF